MSSRASRPGKRTSRIAQWRAEFHNHKYLILIAFVFLGCALLLDYISGHYVDKTSGVIAADLLLDHLPSVDLSYLYLYGYLLVIAVLLLYPLLYDMKEFHIVISQFSLLTLLRSLSICLTHLRAPAEAVALSTPRAYAFLAFNNDLFFSAHTAVPLLGYLLFRKRRIGVFFLVAAVVLAATVLLMHIHYSIDVFAAIFIAYGSYTFGNWFFKKIDHAYHRFVAS